MHPGHSYSLIFPSWQVETFQSSTLHRLFFIPFVSTYRADNCAFGRVDLKCTAALINETNSPCNFWKRYSHPLLNDCHTMTDFADPQVGLRRRHQARLFQPSDNDDNNPDGAEPDSGASENGEERAPRNNVTPLIGPQQPAALRARTPPPLQANNAVRITNGNALGASPNGTVSRWYCLLSTIVMILAVVVAPPSTHSSLSSLILVDHPNTGGNLSKSSIDESHKGTIGKPPRKGQGTATTDVGENRPRNPPEVADSEDWMSWMSSLYLWWQESPIEEKADRRGRKEKGINKKKIQHQGNDHANRAWWARFVKIPDSRSDDPKERNYSSLRSVVAILSDWAPVSVREFFRDGHYERYIQWVDPVLLHPTSTTTTDIIDKVLKSTPRLLIIANFMLAMTYLLHSAVAVWFLGPRHPQQGYLANRGNTPTNLPQNMPPGMVVDWPHSSAGARERMGGFLVFKLLLISAVVAPDTLDLLILLTWYTWLSCLRSLDHLAFTTTTHLAALGHSPRAGAVQLLFLVLGCDIVAAASCVALFHAAGLDMVLLLTCDCALLGADLLSHILKYFQCVLEDTHTSSIRGMEARQLQLHEVLTSSSSNNNSVEEQLHVDHSARHASVDDDIAEEDLRLRRPSSMTNTEVQLESRRLDRRMETMELLHARRLSVLDAVIFSLDLICHMLTIAHFCHIWSLHGVQFTLIDGVLALHLHSAVSTACRKIAQRRNVYSIARDLQGQFPNATDEELKKASSAGDVCCICLGTMSSGGHVKKVKCGHLYHTHCLREIVERAQSLHAARCPLCRASLMDGRNASYDGSSGLDRNNLVAVAPPRQLRPNDVPANELTAPMQQGAETGNERALFRFSTETILPVWLPVPAFSFEVVRRPPMVVPGPPLVTPPRQADPAEISPPAEDKDNVNLRERNGNERDTPQQEEPQQEATETSFLRRLLVLAGAIPMSPEEEARALAQLVDMFPQYDRSDLLRELRSRGSAEAVAEAVLMGVFSGIPRGD